MIQMETIETWLAIPAILTLFWILTKDCKH